MKQPAHRPLLPWYDYSSRSIYHITMIVSDREQILGRIAGDTAATARCELTHLGLQVSRCIQKIPTYAAQKGRKVRILAKVVMPDHVHFVLFVEEPMDCNISTLIHGMKIGCNKALREVLERRESESLELKEEKSEEGLDKAPLTDSKGEKITANNIGEKETKDSKSENDITDSKYINTPTTDSKDDNIYTNSEYVNTPTNDKVALQECEDALLSVDVDLANQSIVNQSTSALDNYFTSDLPINSPRLLQEHALFEPDFDATVLFSKGQLQHMIDYVHLNPQHRWQRQHKPGWLLPQRGIMIAGKSYDAIGNVTLLGMRRHQVWIRSAWDDQTRRNYMNDCILQARQGKALVSPFISNTEKAVRDKCLEEGNAIIQIVNTGFSEVTQCPGNLYPYCEKGQVLLLVPSEYPVGSINKDRISRQQCVELNDIARVMSNEGVNNL